MVQLSFQQQIKHPLWQKKRLEVLKAHKFRCQECNDNEKTLHVHHTFYTKGIMLWGYKLDDLKCLCEDCHKEEHDLDDNIKQSLKSCNIFQKNMILGFIEAETNKDLFETQSEELAIKKGRSLQENEYPQIKLKIRNRGYTYGVSFRFVTSFDVVEKIAIRGFVKIKSLFSIGCDL